MKLLQVLLYVVLVTFAVGDWDEDGIEESVFYDDYYRRPGPPGPRDRSLLDAIRNTALGKEITDKVSENFDAVGRYFTNVGEKLELDKLARKAGEQGEKLVKMDQDFERLGTALDTQMQTFTQDLENRTAALVGRINDELKQTAETIRVKAESIIGSLGQSVQAQLSSFWKSLSKGNE